MNIKDRKNISIAYSPIAVIGLSRSGFAAAKLAYHMGAQVFVSDGSTNENIVANLEELETVGIAGECGGHSDRIFEAELWILSPGIAQDSKLVKKAQAHDITIVSEVEFASWFTTAPIIAVTGSNGKTTTVHALAKMCQTDEIHGVLAGNVGIPFAEMVLKELLEPDPDTVFILEVSSFQSEFLLHFKPQISVFLNITPDHLDRYHSMDEYITAKLNMVCNTDSNDKVIYNSDDPILTQRLSGSSAELLPFSLSENQQQLYSLNKDKIYTSEHATLVTLDAVALPGPHNYSNLMAAATAAHLIGIPDHKIAAVMKTFQGVPHRLEEVGVIAGVRYINDSKATNLDAVKVALQSYPGPIILILGGKDKGGDFTELIPFLKDRVKQVIAIGQAQTRIFIALRDAERPECVRGLGDAVEITRERALPGDLVLLSPGCASFDQYRDYEERGDHFRSLVDKMKVPA